MDALDDNIAVASRMPDDTTSGRYLVDLQKALGDKKVLAIRYQTNEGDVTSRQVEPIGLWFYGQTWHLIAWCRLRGGYRDFRVSRLQHLELLDEHFDPESHPSLHEYMQTMIMQNELQGVVVTFDKGAVKYLGHQKYYYGYVKEEHEGQTVRMHFLVSHLESLGRWLLMYTNACRVESPEALVTIMKELSEELHGHYLPEESFSK
jgi:predicted DNA-binding transcriptional regulator YafY